MGEQPFAREGFALMAAAFEVHNLVGGGLLEEIYQQCLKIELETRSIPFQSKPELKVTYKNRVLEKRYFPDLIVFEKIIVELKSLADIAAEHQAQLINYMRLTHCPIGYLINFGPIGKLQFKRFILSEHVRP